MRKDIFEFVKLMKKDEIKINYAAVARKFNCDYRTVKRYCDGLNIPSPLSSAFRTDCAAFPLKLSTASALIEQFGRRAVLFILK